MSPAVNKGKQASRNPRVDVVAQAAGPIRLEQVAGQRSPSQAPVLEIKELAATSPHDPLVTTIGSRIQVNSLIFDVEWYRAEYPDVAAANLDPVRHYFDNGFREGRNPNRYFDTNWYASSNPDVAAAGLNPFLHYLLYGAREGRRPAP